MNRNNMIKTGMFTGFALAAGLGLLLNSAATAESIHGKLIYEDTSETAYISGKTEYVVDSSEDGEKQESHHELQTDTFETGVRVWRNVAGICYMQKRTLMGMDEHSGVQFPKIHEKTGSADCETREFYTTADFQ